MSATATSDYATWEVILIILVGSCVQGGGLALFQFGQKNLVADLPAIDKGVELPVKVTPVLDLEGLILKQGGKKPVLPDMWQAPAPMTPPTPQQKAATKDPDTISTKKNEKDDDPIEKKDPDRKDAGPEDPVDAGPEDIPDAPVPDTPSDAGDPTSTEQAGNKNEGDDAGAKDGNTTDKTLITQRNAYYARVAGFLSQRGRAGCGGAKGVFSGSATMSGLTVSSISMSGDADPGVVAAMNAAVGATVPAPPDEHPEWAKPVYGLNVPCN